MITLTGRSLLRTRLLLVTPFLLFTLASCDDSYKNAEQPEISNKIEMAQGTTETIQYSDHDAPDLVAIGDSILSDTASSVEQLQAITDQFLQNPDEPTYELVRFAWLTTINKLERFSLFAHLNFSDTDQVGGLSPFFAGAYNNLCAWPVEPGYLDGFDPHPYSGLIHDLSLPIDEENLRAQHQLTDLEEATLGLYSLGTLLFGPDLKRPMTDFQQQTQLNSEQKQQGYQSVNELPVNRRRKLISTQVNLIETDFSKLRALLINKNPEGFGAQISSIEQKELTQMIEQTLALQSTHTLTELAEFQKNHDPEQLTWAQHAYAKRLEGQLNGWLMLANALPIMDKNLITKELEEAISALNEIIKISYIPTIQDKKIQEDWILVFKSLKQISSQLNR